MTSLRKQKALDAVALGCRCWECPFRDKDKKRLPVGPTLPTNGLQAIFVAEGPGKDETTAGQVLVGQTGRLLDGLLKLAKLDRSKLYLTNATKCQPPWGATEDEFDDAVEACRPGLVNELADLPSAPIIAAGGLALQALTGNGAILEFIGVPLPAAPEFSGPLPALPETAPRQVMPVVHPAAALPHRTPALGQVLVEHLSRARDLIDGRWALASPPKRIITDRDGDEVILVALAELWAAPSLGVDVETPMIKRPLEFYDKAKRLLNVGIASYKLSLAVCVTWYEASAAVKDAILKLLASNIPKRLQNGNFDARVFRVNGIAMEAWALDTMDLFKLCYPGLPAGLDFIAAFLTRHERWKDDWRAGRNMRGDGDDGYKEVTGTLSDQDRGDGRVLAMDGSGEQHGLRRNNESRGEGRQLTCSGVESADGPDTGRSRVGSSLSRAAVLQSGTFGTSEPSCELLAGSQTEAQATAEADYSSAEARGLEQPPNSSILGSEPRNSQYISNRRLLSKGAIDYGDEEEDREAQAGADSNASIGYLAEALPIGEGESSTMAKGQAMPVALPSSDISSKSVRGVKGRDRKGATPKKETLDRFERADETERAIYCAKDACHQDEIGDILSEKLLHVHRGSERAAFRHSCILAGVDMWEKGIPISAEARYAHRVPLSADLIKYREEAIAAAKDLGWAERTIVEFGYKDEAGKRHGRLPGGKNAHGPKQFEYDDVVFNPGSTAHLTKLFVHTYGMKPVAYTDKRAPRWDAEVLEYLCGDKNPRVRALARKVRRYKEVQKELGTFVEGLPVFPDDKIHPVWKPCHAISGQWSSEGPNAQTIPKHLRDMIAAATGMWIAEADFAQIELLIVALLSGDIQWLEIFAKGKDIHRANAAAMFGVLLADVTDKQRQAAKPTVYCFQYNGSPKTAWAKLMENEDFKDVKLSSVEMLHKSFFSEHPDIRKFHQECFDDARNGRLVCDLSGHELLTWGYVDPNLDANFRVQTRSRHMTSMGLLNVRNELRERNMKDYSVDAHQHDALWMTGPDPMELCSLLRRNMEQEQTYRGNKAFFKVDFKTSSHDLKSALEMSLDGVFKVPKSKSGSTTLTGWRCLEGVWNT